MNKTSDFFIAASNADGGTNYLPNASGINLPLEPSVADLNRIMSPLAENLKESKPAEAEAPFGTHIKEAIQIVKDWRKK